jgi:hypothetical protein
LMEFEGMWGQYFAIGSKKIIKNLFFYGRYWSHHTDYFAGIYGRRCDRTHLLAGPADSCVTPESSFSSQGCHAQTWNK